MSKLTQCRTCGDTVAKKAKLCPHCGEKKPAKKKTDMKTIAGLIFLLIFLIAIMGPTEEETKSEKQLKTSKNNQLIAQLDAEVKKIPSNQFEKNYFAYSKLVALEPSNKRYQKKLEYYKLQYEMSKKNYKVIKANPNWSSWELNNAVCQHKDFLIIKQPLDSTCFIKQSYENNKSMMELSFIGKFPTITTPYINGIEKSVLYWVDSNPKRSVETSDINEVYSFNLNTDVVEEMKSGKVLYVQIKPLGLQERIQQFSLQGFTVAIHELNGHKCSFSKNDKGIDSSNLKVNLKRISNGDVIVSGSTSLPDGMNLIISLRSSNGDFFAQDKVTVSGNFYESNGFSNKGKPLSTGKYKVTITSSLMMLQPKSVRRKLGSSGSDIPADIRKKSSFSDDYTVGYSVNTMIFVVNKHIMISCSGVLIYTISYNC